MTTRIFQVCFKIDEQILDETCTGEIPQCKSNFIFEQELGWLAQSGITLIGEIKEEKPAQQREQEILALTDEDFQLIGKDPELVSEELFTLVVEQLKEYYNNGFSEVLSTCYQSALSIYRQENSAIAPTAQTV